MSNDDVNRVVLSGRVHCEPEMRYTPDGEPYTIFIMTSCRAKATTEHAELFRLLARGTPLAEECSDLAPATHLLVIGQLHYCSSDNEADCVRFPTEICVEQIMRFGSPPDPAGTTVPAPPPRGPTPIRAAQRKVPSAIHPSPFPGVPRPARSVAVATAPEQNTGSAITLADLPL